MSEPDEVVRRYAARPALANDFRYSMLNPSVWHAAQERQRHLLSFLSTYSHKPVADLEVLEVGCGSGSNLLELLRIGFSPPNLVGNELLPQRWHAARSVLPHATQILAGDATELAFVEGSFDIVYQSLVFSSLLDSGFQERLARKMWSWVHPGGAVLWYDFIANNPHNPDVRGVPLKRIQHLFPEAQLCVRRVTLPPPISRRICRLHPSLYSIFNVTPWLRTHVLCWLHKP